MAAEVKYHPGVAPVLYTNDEWCRQHHGTPEEKGTIYLHDGMDAWGFRISVQTMLRREPTVHTMTLNGSYDVVKAAAIGAGEAFAQMVDVREVIITLRP